MKIIVTGGAGFIGSHIVDAYIEEGHDVVIIDNLSTGREEYINPKAKLYKVDICSPEIQDIFEFEQPEIVNHHAAQKSISNSIDDPLNDAKINIIGLLNLLKFSVMYNIKKVIFASSGGALSQILGEDGSSGKDNSISSPYAASKYMGEIYLDLYHRLYNLNYVILRYSNVYGPRQNVDGDCGVVPIFINNLIDNKESTLFTSDDMPKGTSRDFIYVKDVCKINLLCLEKGNYLNINIASGKETYTADLYYLLQQITGKKTPLLKGNIRRGELKRSVLDIRRAFETLSWVPETNLLLGLSETLIFINASKTNNLGLVREGVE